MGSGPPNDGLPQIHQTNPIAAILRQAFSIAIPVYVASQRPFFGGPRNPMLTLQEGVLEVPPGGGRLIQVLEDGPWWICLR